MRVVLFGFALLGTAVPVSAGVYSTIDPMPALPPAKIRSWVSQLRAVGVIPARPLDAGSLRAFYLRQARALEEVKANGVFSTEDLLNLSACYIRLRIEDAGGGKQRDLWREAVRLLNNSSDRNHFLVQANLASAYFLQGDLDLAIRCQQRALDGWQDVCAPFGRLVWYRRCEKTFLRLLENRREEAAPGRRNVGQIDIDPIFPGLRLVGPGPKGEYQAGGLASSVNDRIPADAYETMLQLVLWYPQDMRLYWLLGELLNAGGQVPVAYEILEELNKNIQVFKDLNVHFRVLRSAAEIFKQLKLETLPGQAMLAGFFNFIPNGGLTPPGIGVAAQGVGVAALAEMARLQEQQPGPPPGVMGDADGQPNAAGPTMPFNWRHVAVSFGFGFLVAALIGFQWQEWRRRRMLQELEARDVEPPAPKAE
jgi:hypothetical protein